MRFDGLEKLNPLGSECANRIDVEHFEVSSGNRNKRALTKHTQTNSM